MLLTNVWLLITWNCSFIEPEVHKEKRPEPVPEPTKKGINI